MLLVRPNRRDAGPTIPSPLRRVCAVLLMVLVLSAALAMAGCRATRDNPPGGEAVAAVTEPAPPPPPPRSFTMVAVGDIMLDRTVGRRIAANGAESILARVRDELRAADVTFANLECPLAEEGAHAPHDCIFRADPDTVQVLLDGGIDIVSLANNHTLNSGTGALMETIDHLEDAGMAYCGAARDRERAWEPRLLTVDRALLGFVACTDLSFEHGSMCKVGSDLEAFEARIADAKAQCELLVVSIHWGNEYQKVPTQRQRRVARAAIDAGADLIIGHHPHTLQGVGSYRGAPILYSCGNFVFDQREGERMESAIFHLTWHEEDGWQIRMVPVWIPIARCGPIYPDEARATKIIARLATLSGNLGVPVTVQGTEGLARIGGTQAPTGQVSAENFVAPPTAAAERAG